MERIFYHFLVYLGLRETIRLRDEYYLVFGLDYRALNIAYERFVGLLCALDLRQNGCQAVIVKFADGLYACERAEEGLRVSQAAFARNERQIVHPSCLMEAVFVCFYVVGRFVERFAGAALHRGVYYEQPEAGTIAERVDTAYFDVGILFRDYLLCAAHEVIAAAYARGYCNCQDILSLRSILLKSCTELFDVGGGGRLGGGVALKLLVKLLSRYFIPAQERRHVNAIGKDDMGVYDFNIVFPLKILVQITGCICKNNKITHGFTPFYSLFSAKRSNPAL